MLSVQPPAQCASCKPQGLGCVPQLPPRTWSCLCTVAGNQCLVWQGSTYIRALGFSFKNIEDGRGFSVCSYKDLPQSISREELQGFLASSSQPLGGQLIAHSGAAPIPPPSLYHPRAALMSRAPNMRLPMLLLFPGGSLSRLHKPHCRAGYLQ